MSSGEGYELKSGKIFSRMSSQFTYQELLKTNPNLAFAEKNKNEQNFLGYFHLFGNLILNKFSLPYLMIRLGDTSKIYEEHLAEILIPFLTLDPPKQSRDLD